MTPRGVKRLQTARADLVIPVADNASNGDGDDAGDGSSSSSALTKGNQEYTRTCAELDPQTKTAIGAHYKFDYCVFGYINIEGGGADIAQATCGALSRAEYTSRLAKCKAMADGRWGFKSNIFNVAW